MDIFLTNISIETLKKVPENHTLVILVYTMIPVQRFLDRLE